MVMHKKHLEFQPHYWVLAHVHEPDYVTELKFIGAELAVIEHKLGKANTISLPKLGFFSHANWRWYAHRLEDYQEALMHYRDDVAGGVLPVKFIVHNSGDLPDSGIYVKVKLTNGKIDEKKKVPERPERLDGGGKPWKFKLPKLEGFARDGVKITPHTVVARFSGLKAHDGAVLVNQLVHVHCTEETNVLFQISSRNVPHETGLVELA